MTRMPFGKWKDYELDEVPRPYLTWLRGQPWLGAWLVQEIDDVLSDETEASEHESFAAVLEKCKQEWSRKKETNRA